MSIPPIEARPSNEGFFRKGRILRPQTTPIPSDEDDANRNRENKRRKNRNRTRMSEKEKVTVAQPFSLGPSLSKLVPTFRVASESDLGAAQFLFNNNSKNNGNICNNNTNINNSNNDGDGNGDNITDENINSDNHHRNDGDLNQIKKKGVESIESIIEEEGKIQQLQRQQNQKAEQDRLANIISHTMVRSWIRQARFSIQKKILRKKKQMEKKAALLLREERKIRDREIREQNRQALAVEQRLLKLRKQELKRREQQETGLTRGSIDDSREFAITNMQRYNDELMRGRSLGAAASRIGERLKNVSLTDEDTRTWVEIARVDRDMVVTNVPKDSGVTSFMKKLLGIEDTVDIIKEEEKGEDVLTELSPKRKKRGKSKKKGKSKSPEKKKGKGRRSSVSVSRSRSRENKGEESVPETTDIDIFDATTDLDEDDTMEMRSPEGVSAKNAGASASKGKGKRRKSVMKRKKK